MKRMYLFSLQSDIRNIVYFRKTRRILHIFYNTHRITGSEPGFKVTNQHCLFESRREKTNNVVSEQV